MKSERIILTDEDSSLLGYDAMSLGLHFQMHSSQTPQFLKTKKLHPFELLRNTSPAAQQLIP
jgi:hypothetical protein